MNNLGDSLGLVFLEERTSPENNTVNNINVIDSNGVFYVEFDSNLHSFDVMNRNDRMYTGQNVWSRIVTDDRIQSQLHDNSWFGEQDHPFQITQNAKLTPERMMKVYLPNRSHKIMNPRLNRNLLQAHIQTSAGTDAGVGMAKDIIQGMIPDFSCRSVAELKPVDGKPLIDVKRIITYDWVLYPSHKEAHKISDIKPVMKRPNVYSESGEQICVSSKDIEIPLTEILKNIGEKDPTINVIMESFELSEKDLVGFDTSLSHAKIQLEDGMIYANINPRSVMEVKDFMSSF